MFALEIERAPRGVPQIVVEFDIDANNTLKVTAWEESTERKRTSMSFNGRLDQDAINACQQMGLGALMEVEEEEFSEPNLEDDKKWMRTTNEL